MRLHAWQTLHRLCVAVVVTVTVRIGGFAWLGAAEARRDGCSVKLREAEVGGLHWVWMAVLPEVGESWTLSPLFPPCKRPLVPWHFPYRH